ncbi:hypothetical protein [Pelosinus fermentans]|uniref:Uncharacterized protein n=1 Tax=Pelosinus fermentans JBW45 TaxID=1192197 RepID=I9NSA8_9FIRM|nr:hypothetical protein [Pelosinus fermentans]AJQ27632.1 hypothetical protein JBW_02286 [Pelosinus fermentans JBW45]
MAETLDIIVGGAGDERFGSQSDEILPMVIDAVKQVASRFGVVLVIGRVKAVQEVFDQKPEDESVEVLVHSSDALLFTAKTKSIPP